MLTYTFSSAEDANRKLGEIKRLMKNENMKIEGLGNSMVLPKIERIPQKSSSLKLISISITALILIQSLISFFLIFFAKGKVNLTVTTECPVNASRIYGEVCNILPCKTELGLVCQTGNQTCNCPLQSKKSICDCERSENNEYYWDGSSCVAALEYNEMCYNSSTTYMCKTISQGTVCIGSPYQCKCNSTQYLNYATSKCENLLSIGDTCQKSDACNSNLGLTCQNYMCQCDPFYQFWSIFNASCINYLTYDSGLCTSHDQCSGGLICKKSGISCTCPEIVGDGKCDCPLSLNGNEYYWDGSACTSALEFNQTCSNSSANYMCKTLTQGTICDGSIPPYKCICSSDQYFNFANSKCENLLSFNETCLQADSCNMKLNLTCKSGICQCASLSGCSGMMTYNSGPCTSNNDCSGNLICRASGVSCNCPTNVLIGKCDCPPRITGNEYYWNGINCTLALGFKESCQNNLTSYMCKTLTQGTVCSGSPYECKCNTSQYYNYATSKCENLLLHNVTCQQNDSCNSAKGLYCKNQLCMCNSSIQFWNPSTLSCTYYYSYGQGSCTATNQCLSNTNLLCQVFKCSCATSYDWSGTKCVTCPTGWKHQRGSCFFTTSYGTNGIKNPNSLSNTTLISACKNQASARLAVLYTSDFPIETFLSGLDVVGDFWFDLFRSSNSDPSYSSTNGNSSLTYSNTYWAAVWPSGFYCTKWASAKKKFESDDCTHGHDLICEIVL